VCGSRAQCFSYFSEVFNWLPLGCVLGGAAFIVHGGLFSRDDVTLDELRALNRNREPPEVRARPRARSGAAAARCAAAPPRLCAPCVCAA
jgi:diadenosine tetraphosphatase ApaH/serine/threonine PP2A family protein phosphatase